MVLRKHSMKARRWLKSLAPFIAARIEAVNPSFLTCSTSPLPIKRSPSNILKWSMNRSTKQTKQPLNRPRILYQNHTSPPLRSVVSSGKTISPPKKKINRKKRPETLFSRNYLSRKGTCLGALAVSVGLGPSRWISAPLRAWPESVQPSSEMVNSPSEMSHCALGSR